MKHAFIAFQTLCALPVRKHLEGLYRGHERPRAEFTLQPHVIEHLGKEVANKRGHKLNSDQFIHHVNHLNHIYIIKFKPQRSEDSEAINQEATPSSCHA